MQSSPRIVVLLFEQLGHVHLEEHNPAEHAQCQRGTCTLARLRNAVQYRGPAHAKPFNVCTIVGMMVTYDYDR